MMHCVSLMFSYSMIDGDDPAQLKERDKCSTIRMLSAPVADDLFPLLAIPTKTTVPMDMTVRRVAHANMILTALWLQAALKTFISEKYFDDGSRFEKEMGAVRVSRGRAVACTRDSDGLTGLLAYFRMLSSLEMRFFRNETLSPVSFQWSVPYDAPCPSMTLTALGTTASQVSSSSWGALPWRKRPCSSTRPLLHLSSPWPPRETHVRQPGTLTTASTY